MTIANLFLLAQISEPFDGSGKAECGGFAANRNPAQWQKSMSRGLIVAIRVWSSVGH
jgi:hypothetical protein